MKITGIVFSGAKEASKYMDMIEYKERFNSILGFVPFSGTLNLKVADEDIPKIEKLEPIIIDGFSVGEKKFDSIKCYKVSILGKSAAIVIPENSRYKKYNISAIEIVSSASLRESLNLKDGDSLEVELPGL